MEVEVRKSNKLLVVHGAGWLGNGEKKPCQCKNELETNGVEPLYPAGTVDEETEEISVNQGNDIEPLYPAGIE